MRRTVRILHITLWTDGLGKVANSGSTVSTTELAHLDLTVPWILAVLIRNLLNMYDPT